MTERGPLGLMRGYWVSISVLGRAFLRRMNGKGRGGQALLPTTQATNAVWIPWNMLYMSLYEQFKLLAAAGIRRPPLQHPKLTKSEQEGGPGPPLQKGEQEEEDVALPPWALLMCSASAASVAAVATHPIDVVKTRLQVRGGS